MFGILFTIYVKKILAVNGNIVSAGKQMILIEEFYKIRIGFCRDFGRWSIFLFECLPKNIE